MKYRGRLAAPYVSEPANMIVRFTLSEYLDENYEEMSLLHVQKSFISDPLTASFVVMDTDYTNYALICTCQGKKFFFDILTFHRRSCTILQRSPERDSAISRKVNFYIILTYFGIKTLVLQQFSSLKKQV